MVTRVMNAWAVLALIAMVGVGSDAAIAQGVGAETAEKPSLYDRLGGLASFGRERQAAAGAFLGQGTRSSALAHEFLSRLHENGLKNVLMLTGDRLKEEPKDRRPRYLESVPAIQLAKQFDPDLFVAASRLHHPLASLTSLDLRHGNAHWIRAGSRNLNTER